MTHEAHVSTRNWLKSLRELVTRKGLRYSRTREAVAREFFESGTHIGIEELLKKVQKRNRKVGVATIYRTMGLLVDGGVAVKRDFATGPSKYEPAGGKHHDHLLCTRCGKVVEFAKPEIESMQVEIAARHGFKLSYHKMELYGVCRQCKKR